jgi:hypothetical protein
VFICKAHLDGQKSWERARATADKSLRDGAGWLAQHFDVEKNPAREGNEESHAGHVYYYLYGLERAGVLLLAPRFGTHDWYVDGCNAIVREQSTNGSWDGGRQGTVGAVCDTSFALLFLARGTTPIVRIPTRTVTGVGNPAK